MAAEIVRTQAELGRALDSGVDWIEIRSEPGVWIAVRACGSATVTACDSATVTAYDSATVRACGSATVRAYDSATVTAYDSATVRACDSATVTAYDSATVTACDSATVTAYDSATVTACDSATVTACDSATVRAYDSATVTACDSATVRAGTGTAVHLHSGYANIAGGVIIDHTKERDMTPAQWCDYHGVTVADDTAYVYKAVDGNWTTDRGTDYSPGSTPNAPDWRDDQSCGGGLHFSPTPTQALSYHPEATRFVRVGIALDTLRPIHGGTAKCKAPAVTLACVEVDQDMNPISEEN